MLSALVTEGLKCLDSLFRITFCPLQAFSMVLEWACVEGVSQQPLARAVQECWGSTVRATVLRVGSPWMMRWSCFLSSIWRVLSSPFPAKLQKELFVLGHVQSTVQYRKREGCTGPVYFFLYVSQMSLVSFNSKCFLIK